MLGFGKKDIIIEEDIIDVELGTLLEEEIKPINNSGEILGKVINTKDSVKNVILTGVGKIKESEILKSENVEFVKSKVIDGVGKIKESEILKSENVEFVKSKVIDSVEKIKESEILKSENVEFVKSKVIDSVEKIKEKEILKSENVEVVKNKIIDNVEKVKGAEFMSQENREVYIETIKGFANKVVSNAENINKENIKDVASKVAEKVDSLSAEDVKEIGDKIKGGIEKIKDSDALTPETQAKHFHNVFNVVNATVDKLMPEDDTLKRWRASDGDKNLPEIGDHIYANRYDRGVPYSHHGLYVGNDKVLEYHSTGVRFSSIYDFLDASEEIRILDEEKSPLLVTIEEAIVRGCSRLEESEYNLMFNNCEHFVRWCRSGVKYEKGDII